MHTAVESGGYSLTSSVLQKKTLALATQVALMCTYVCSLYSSAFIVISIIPNKLPYMHGCANDLSNQV